MEVDGEDDMAGSKVEDPLPKASRCILAEKIQLDSTS